MSFRSGSIGYRRFRVLGDASAAPDEALFARLHEHPVRAPSVGAPPERMSGFCTGRHIFDAEYTYEACAFAASLLAAVRIDTSKVPSEVRSAYRIMAEDARRSETPEGISALSRGARKEAKEEAEERCRRDLAEGRYRRSAMTDFLWDLPEGLLLAPATSEAIVSEFKGLFDAALGVRIEARSAGGVASELLGRRGRTAVLEDALPDALAARPEGAQQEERDAGLDERPQRMRSRPEIPWAAAAGEPLDFLGNLFLLWLWHHCDCGEGVIETPGPTAALVIERQLDMECAWGVTGRQSLHGETPSRLPEAYKALQAGKWPRRMGLLVAAHGQEFRCTVQGDRFAVTGLVQVADEDEEKPRSQRELLERRIDGIQTFDRILLALYEQFLIERFAPTWDSRSEELRAWIARGGAAARRSASRVEVKGGAALEEALAES